MNGEILKRATARRDLASHTRFIAANQPSAALRFLAAAEQTFQQLLEMPTLGRRWESSNPGLAGVRVWPVRGFRKYLIFYRPIDDGIEILHVFHGARDIPTVLEDEEPEV